MRTVTPVLLGLIAIALTLIATPASAWKLPVPKGFREFPPPKVERLTPEPRERLLETPEDRSHFHVPHVHPPHIGGQDQDSDQNK